MEQRDPRITTSFVDANDLRFEVDQCGDDRSTKLALCLHGFPEHSYSWRFQLPMLADMGYVAWAPNLRGYGNSSRPTGMGAYAIENLMEDVASLIDASGKDEVTLIAHDWGAVIAWLFAIRQIRPLNKLVVCNVPHPATLSSELSWAQIKRSWYGFFFQLPVLPERYMSRNDGIGLRYMMRAGAIDRSNFSKEVGQVYYRNAMRPGVLTAMINYYRAYYLGGGLRRQRKLGFKTIEAPTLMLWGEADTALSKESTYGTESWVQDYRVRYLPYVSHWVQQEQPEAVNAMIAAFLLDKPIPRFVWNWYLHEV